ncbi:MAG TPA: hypothetical protein VG755_10675, partial [Nannocystaceae bacterium]|nr:hypothetical protein [Nannocystaceae bacterium]
LLQLASNEHDEHDDMTPRDAEVGWTAMNHAVAQGHDDFSAQVQLATDGELLVSCPAGGNMQLVGHMDELDDFRLDVAFDHCASDDVLIDGDVTVVARIDVDVDIDDDDGEPDHAGAGIVVDYDGELVFDGDVEGTCSIDASVRAGAIVFDGFAAAGVSVTGHICDNDADVVVHGEVE